MLLVMGHSKGSNGINHDILKKKGFSDYELNQIEDLLPEAFDIRYAFSRWTLGDEFCRDALGLTDKELRESGSDLLPCLRFQHR